MAEMEIRRIDRRLDDLEQQRSQVAARVATGADPLGRSADTFRAEGLRRLDQVDARIAVERDRLRELLERIEASRPDAAAANHA
jgi:hypothetical protein